MRHPFREGDKVRCLNSLNYDDFLNLNEIYTIKYISFMRLSKTPIVFLEEVGGKDVFFWASRFVHEEKILDLSEMEVGCEV